MPTYKVIAPGFYDGKLYDPEGKRKTLTTDKPFTKKKGKNPLPSWLTEMPKESEAVRKKREAQKSSQKDADEQSTEEQVALASTEGDAQEASFIGETAGNSNVETL